MIPTCPVCKTKLVSKIQASEMRKRDLKKLNWVKLHPLCYFDLEGFSNSLEDQGFTEDEIKERIYQRYN